MDDNFTHWSQTVEVVYLVDTSIATTSLSNDCKTADNQASNDEQLVNDALVPVHRKIVVVQDPDSFVLGTTVWDASKTLLKYIEQHSQFFRGFSSICELGAGCGGLAGIACAINNRGLSTLVLTDITPVVPWLRENVHANLTLKERERMHIEVYDWGTPPTQDCMQKPFDCLLCADVVYDQACIRPLMQSILALSHRKTTIFFANERRAPKVRDTFVKYMTKYFNWKQVPSKELDPMHWKESIEVFQLRPKKRTVPAEMVINEIEANTRRGAPIMQEGMVFQ